jgi:hypothetical protein
MEALIEDVDLVQKGDQTIEARNLSSKSSESSLWPG